MSTIIMNEEILQYKQQNTILFSTFLSAFNALYKVHKLFLLSLQRNIHIIRVLLNIYNGQGV
jgi:hypothetical protein